MEGLVREKRHCYYIEVLLDEGDFMYYFNKDATKIVYAGYLLRDPFTLIRFGEFVDDGGVEYLPESEMTDREKEIVAEMDLFLTRFKSVEELHNFCKKELSNIIDLHGERKMIK